MSQSQYTLLNRFSNNARGKHTLTLAASSLVFILLLASLNISSNHLESAKTYVKTALPGLQSDTQQDIKINWQANGAGTWTSLWGRPSVGSGDWLSRYPGNIKGPTPRPVGLIRLSSTQLLTDNNAGLDRQILSSQSARSDR